MTKNEVFELIQEWQDENGESFVDYFDADLRTVSYMFWCRGKGYISLDNFHKWESDYNNDGSMSANSFVYNYGLPDYDHWEDAEIIVAEFISESETYTDRFVRFLEEHK